VILPSDLKSDRIKCVLPKYPHLLDIQYKTLVRRNIVWKA